MFGKLPRTVVACTALVLSLGLAGCVTAERHPDIPVAAMMGAEGTSQLAYNAPSDGMAYVYDVTDEEIVYAGEVDEGDLVVVDPENYRVAVDGQTVAENTVNAGNVHRIYFLDEGRTKRRVIHTEEVEVED